MKLNKSLNIGLFSLFVVILTQGCSFLFGIYTAKILNISEYGALNLIKSLLLYAPLYALGIPQALMYLIPQSIGDNDIKEADFNKNLLFTISLTSLLFILLFSIPYIYNFNLNGISLGINWLVIAAVILSTSLSSFAVFIYRVDMEFLKLSFARLIYPIVFSIVAFLLISKFKITGFLISMFVANVFMFFYFLIDNKHFKYKVVWDFKKIKENIKFGLPIRLNTLIWSFFITIDLWIVSIYLGKDEAGLYSFVALAITAFDVVPSVLREFIVPKLARKFKELDSNELVRLVNQVNRLFLVLCFSLQILVFNVFYVLITNYLTKFTEIIPLISIILIGNYIGSIRFILGDVLILMQKQKSIAIINASILFLVILLDLIAAIYFQSLQWVAIATACGIAFIGIFEYLYFLYIKKLPFNLNIKFASLGVLSFLFIYLNFLITTSNFYFISLILIMIPIYFATRKFLEIWSYLNRK